MKYKKLIQKLHNLKFIKDDEKYHSEESVLHHSLQAYRIARRESDHLELWVAALFHDIGKSIERKGHEKISLDILESFGYYNSEVFWLIKNHMRIRGFLSGELKRWGKVQELILNESLPHLVHLRRCDAIGRKVGRSIEFDRGYINDLLEETNGMF